MNIQGKSKGEFEMVKKDKYLSIAIVLILVLIANKYSTGIFSMFVNLMVYIFALKVIMKCIIIVQDIIKDFKEMFK